MTTEQYPGTVRSVIARSRRVLKAAEIPIGRILGRYPNQSTRAGARVTRLGCSKSAVLDALAASQYAPAERATFDRALTALRANGLPFNDRGIIECAHADLKGKQTMTTEHKHTPGSWHVNAIKAGRIVGDETTMGWDKLQINGGNCTIASVYRPADARLIARAPDLLAENERLRAELASALEWAKDEQCVVLLSKLRTQNADLLSTLRRTADQLERTVDICEVSREAYDRGDTTPIAVSPQTTREARYALTVARAAITKALRNE